jgi:hypothetical protein
MGHALETHLAQLLNDMREAQHGSEGDAEAAHSTGDTILESTVIALLAGGLFTTDEHRLVRAILESYEAIEKWYA